MKPLTKPWETRSGAQPFNYDTEGLSAKCGTGFRRCAGPEPDGATVNGICGTAREGYPLSSNVGALRHRGVRPIIGWPYFLVDECDDGFITIYVAPHISEWKYMWPV